MILARRRLRQNWQAESIEQASILLVIRLSGLCQKGGAREANASTNLPNHYAALLRKLR